MKPRYSGGPNIAVKVPAHQFDATVRFYAEVLGLDEVARQGTSIAFTFGDNRLWLDRVDQLSKSEVWLQVATDDLAAAEAHLAGAGVVRCDEVEPLDEGVRGFWVADAAGNILLIHQDDD